MVLLKVEKYSSTIILDIIVSNKTIKNMAKRNKKQSDKQPILENEVVYNDNHIRGELIAYYHALNIVNDKINEILNLKIYKDKKMYSCELNFSNDIEHSSNVEGSHITYRASSYKELLNKILDKLFTDNGIDCEMIRKGDKPLFLITYYLENREFEKYFVVKHNSNTNE